MPKCAGLKQQIFSLQEDEVENLASDAKNDELVAALTKEKTEGESSDSGAVKKVELLKVHLIIAMCRTESCAVHTVTANVVQQPLSQTRLNKPVIAQMPGWLVS